MSITQFTTEQYTNKSITSEKLADNISITGSLSVPSIGYLGYILSMGNSLSLDGVTIEGVTRTAKGLLLKNGSVDILHVDDAGNLYVPGNISFGGTMNSTTTTVNTLEVADYEIKLNASVTTPYVSGARITVERGGSNYEPYIEWNESGKIWNLYDGTNIARVIDEAYADSRYLKLSGGTMTGVLNLSGHDLTAVNSISIADPGPKEGISWEGGNLWRIYESPNDLTTNSGGNFQFVKDTTRVLTLDTSNNAEFTGMVTVTGNRITFGNGSTISNEIDNIIDIRGDGTARIYGSSGATSSFYVDSNMAGNRVDSEAYCRTIINLADGKIGFGPGSTTRDTWLYRDNNNSLKTDGALTAVGDFTAANIIAITALKLKETGTTPTYYTTLQSGDLAGNITLTLPSSTGTITALGNAVTGSGSIVLAGAPTLTTPILGAATATSINKVAITAPTSSATITIADGKTFTCNNSITLAGTDGKTLTCNNSITLAGTDGSTLSIGAGGTLGTAAFTASTAYLASSTTSTQSGYFGDVYLYDDSTPSHYLKVTNSSNLTALRTLSIDTVDADRTISLAGNLTLANTLTTAGNFALTLTCTAATNVTLPTSGTLSTVPTNHAANAATYGYGDTTNAGHLRVGTGLSVATGTVSVAYGTTSTTACVGNDTRLTGPREPTAHGDSYHNHQKFARITYTGGTSNIAYQWNHGLNSANVIFSIASSSPETHYYYTIVDNNNVKIYLDDAPYETIALDVVATLPTALTSATANLTT